MSRPRSFSSKMGYVYFIRTGSFVKIGFSQSSTGLRRIKKIQVASPYSVEQMLVLPGTMGDESTFHERFKEYRHRGEWFRLKGELLNFILSSIAK